MTAQHTERERRRQRGRRIEDLATSDQDGHVTVQAFASYLAVSEKTVMKWIRAGLLPAYRFPTARRDRQGLWRIQLRDAIAFVEQQRIGG